MQSKIKDTNMQNILDFNEIGGGKSKFKDEKELGSPMLSRKRNRTNSIVIANSIKNNLNQALEKDTENRDFLGNLSSALGVGNYGSQEEEEKELNRVREGRTRGMSAVDEGNIMQLKNNTFSMIENHIQRAKHTQAKGGVTT